MTATKPLHVSVLGLPEASHVTVAGLSETLGIFPMLSGLNEDMPTAPPFEVVIVGDDDQPDSPDIPFRIQARISDIRHTDIIIVPSLVVSPTTWQLRGYDHVVAWLDHMHNQGVNLCSACSGALLLAQTGLLDDYQATTHWVYAELFRRQFPRVDLHEEKLLLSTGTQDDILMSGSSGSWHDLALYLITRHVSLAAAQVVAKFLLLQWHPDGQLPYIMFMPRRDHDDAIVLRAQNWLDENLSAPHPVECMRINSGLSERTFKRRFSRATGLTPIHYVQKSRIEAAKLKLEQSSLSIDEIAWRVGYSDPSFFRRLFKRTNGITAGAHRRKMRVPSAV